MSACHLFLLSFPYSSWEPFGIRSVPWSSFPSCVVVPVRASHTGCPQLTALLGSQPEGGGTGAWHFCAVQQCSQWMAPPSNPWYLLRTGFFMHSVPFRGSPFGAECCVLVLLCTVSWTSSQDVQRATAHRHVTKTKLVFPCDSLHSWSPDTVPFQGQDVCPCVQLTARPCRPQQAEGLWLLAGLPYLSPALGTEHLAGHPLAVSRGLAVLPCSWVSQSGADAPQSGAWACWCNPQSTVRCCLTGTSCCSGRSITAISRGLCYHAACHCCVMLHVVFKPRVHLQLAEGGQSNTLLSEYDLLWETRYPVNRFIWEIFFVHIDYFSVFFTSKVW